mgnify:CR=1 FL=1
MKKTIGIISIVAIILVTIFLYGAPLNNAIKAELPYNYKIINVNKSPYSLIDTRTIFLNITEFNESARLHHITVVFRTPYDSYHQHSSFIYYYPWQGYLIMTIQET